MEKAEKFFSILYVIDTVLAVLFWIVALISSFTHGALSEYFSNPPEDKRIFLIIYLFAGASCHSFIAGFLRIFCGWTHTEGRLICETLVNIFSRIAFFVLIVGSGYEGVLLYVVVILTNFVDFAISYGIWRLFEKIRWRPYIPPTDYWD